ncbi:MAG: bifunctional homocysteine S-methyltransferase/methylenetetrahydrofolate reductase [Planctomycetes bacterium GWF2_50_10]|nr:MAG: bifunctional homocysteine S-methyltransferase/methylenetetrahydrofolate reductase [Planctomycetes bacterium GWF2_50_10]
MQQGPLQKLLSQRVIIGDGAMGTMLYSQGVFVNSCFDELNLSNPVLIKKIHQQYVEAGADFIETNTFGANECKLARFGLADKVELINTKAVQIAREAAPSTVLIAGAAGPLDMEIEPYGSFALQKVKDAFKRQISSLAKAGVDFLILETFVLPEELCIAIEAARSVCDLEIIAQLTVDSQQETKYGQRVDEAILTLPLEHVTAVGLNCSVGPSAMLAGLELLLEATDKPVSLQPNAGMPRQVDGRMVYMCTPEYMAEYAKRFFEKGARIIAGCCGTEPQHIKQMVKAVRALDKAVTAKPKSPSVLSVGRETSLPPTKSLGQKSKFGHKLASRQKVTTVEIVPPRGVDLTAIYQKAQLCAKAGVDAINIPDGPRASSRLSPMVAAIKIEQTCGIETIVHVCGRDRNLIGIQADMLGAYAIGLRNVLAITGDPPKLGEYPDATAVFDLDSIGMVRLIRNLNAGIDLGANRFSPQVELTIGVGVNPAAVDLKREVERYRAKIDAGAEYAITQPVFDRDCLERFLEITSDCKIPVIAGIWPFASFKNAEFMANEVPGVVVPSNILERMRGASDRNDAVKTGIDIAKEMIDSVGDKVAGFAVSAPFGNVGIALAVLGKSEIT